MAVLALCDRLGRLPSEIETMTEGELNEMIAFYHLQHKEHERGR